MERDDTLKDLIDSDELLTELEEFKNRNREHVAQVFDKPRYTAKQACKISGISQAKLRNHINRKTINFDADELREGNENRLFTGSDILRLTAVEAFTEIGVPLSWAAELAVYVVSSCREAMGKVQGMYSSPYYTVQPGVDGPKVDGPYYPHNEKSLPRVMGGPVGIYFRPLDIGKRVFEALGYAVVIGTAKDIRKAAEEMKESETTD